MVRIRVRRVWVVAVLAVLWIALLCVLIASQQQPGDPPGSRASGPARLPVAAGGW